MRICTALIGDQGSLMVQHRYPSHMKKCNYIKGRGVSSFLSCMLPLTAVKLHISTTEVEESSGGYIAGVWGEG